MLKGDARVADALRNRRVEFVVAALQQLGEATPRQVHATMPPKRRGGIGDVAAKLRMLREAGMATVRRVCDAAGDPNDYNAYRMCDEEPGHV